MAVVGGVALRIDDRPFAARAGETILDACRRAGVSVPTLCHVPGLSAPSVCRLCLVEVAGASRPVPACSTFVAPGMTISTRTPALVAGRRAAVELLLAGGRHVCAFCPANGRCELQELARVLGIDHVHRGALRPPSPVDATREGFLLDPDRCVLCTRCIRVCAELEGAGTLSTIGRGSRSRIAVDGGIRWGESRSCTDCGRCTAVCPTGALVARAGAAQGLGDRRPLPPPPRAAPLPRPSSGARKLRLATMWLGGCAGCHMSLLDLDGGLLDLAPHLELAWSPLGDVKEMPDEIDLCLVEGAATTDEQLEQLRRARDHSRTLVALGDCATSGGVPAMRDGGIGVKPLLARWAGPARSAADHAPELPTLLERVVPLAEAVAVDVHLPGCPPSAAAIGRLLADTIAGRSRALAGHVRFG